MDRIQLYKEFYFKDLSRKVELDTAVNIPILVLTTTITLNTYFLKESTENFLFVLIGLCIFLFISITVCLFYLAKSFFNLGKTNEYRELNNMETYYKYGKELAEKNLEVQFEPFLEERLASCSGHNFDLNKRRTINLAIGKRWLFFTIVLTFLSSIIYISSLIVNNNQINKQMPTEKPTPPSNETVNQTPVTESKPDIVIGPTDVYIQNSQDSIPNHNIFKDIKK